MCFHVLYINKYQKLLLNGLIDYVMALLVDFKLCVAFLSVVAGFCCDAFYIFFFASILLCHTQKLNFYSNFHSVLLHFHHLSFANQLLGNYRLEG